MSITGSSRLALAWARVRDGLWFTPAVAVLAGVVLATVAVLVPTPQPESRLARLWLFSGGAEGARGVLSAIAGSLITVTATVFSVTIVALQLASSQFSPRILGSFVADRINQAVLGIFIGTFTYTLLVLRTIHSEQQDRVAFVPHVGVTLALVLLLLSIGALIVFIDHAAQSIRASVILRRETARTLARIEELFPAHVGEPAGVGKAQPRVVPPEGAPARVVATESGYLQSLHAAALWRLDVGDERGPVTVRMEMYVGEFAFPGKVLASVWPASRADAPMCDAVRAAFVLGPERTHEQDVEFGLVALSDIAVKALSPGINDPTTALQCIDRLTELVAALGRRRPPDDARTGGSGRVVLFARDTSYERALGVAFDQVRHYGANNPLVASRLLMALGELADVAPGRSLPLLAEQVASTHRAARRDIEEPMDLARVDQAERVARSAIDARMHPGEATSA
jgi:uncharacterized membrane protein